MRSKGPSRQTMGKRALSQSTSGCLTRRAAASSSLTVCIGAAPGCLQEPPGRAGQGPSGHHGDGPRLAAPRRPKPKPPQKPRRDRHRFVLRRRTSPGRAPLPAAGLPRPRTPSARGGKPAPLAAAPGSHCLPFLKRPRGEDLCGISENLGFRPV